MGCEPMTNAILACLLAHANAWYPRVCEEYARWRFYHMKDAILQRHGSRVGSDLQHIVHKCWRCEGTGQWRNSGEDCMKCGGTGIFREFWVLLHRWELGGRIFHKPGERCTERPSARPNIQGTIRHPVSLQRWSRLCAFLLALRYDRVLAREIAYRAGARIVQPARNAWWRVSRGWSVERCHWNVAARDHYYTPCTRRFLPVWSGSECYCRQHAKEMREAMEIPF